MNKSPINYSSAQIVALRGHKNRVDPTRPYAFLVEPEINAAGELEDVATLFLTNRECPYHCLMCDLWKNTLDETIPTAAIPQQIRFALSQLPTARHIKLYNSGNFFDPRAIPPENMSTIAELVAPFKTVIVENHPKLCHQQCIDFQQQLNGQLEIALGLETIEPSVLRALNKQMTLDDFARAVDFLRNANIHIRTFILIRPPFMTDQQGCDWAVQSLMYAFSCGAQVCSLIPTRSGNGIMERLEQRGEFAPPSLRSIEAAFDAGLNLKQGRVFLDTWNLELFPGCGKCDIDRHNRLRAMNVLQQVQPRVECACETFND